MLGNNKKKTVFITIFSGIIALLTGYCVPIFLNDGYLTSALIYVAAAAINARNCAYGIYILTH